MKKLLALPVIITGIILLISCSKDTRKYELKVIVTVNDSIRAQNALVHIYAPVDNTFVDYFEYTNENGETPVIKFNNKAIVEITAGRGPFKGCGFAEVNRGVQTVYINMTLPGDPASGCLPGN